MQLPHQDNFIIAAAGFLVWGILVMIQIVRKISSKPARASLLLFDIIVMKYLAAYRKITREEKGSIGHLYYQFFIAMWLAVASALVFVILSIK